MGSDLVGFFSFSSAFYFFTFLLDGDEITLTSLELNLLRWQPTTVIIYLVIPSVPSTTSIPIPIAIETSSLAVAAESGQGAPAPEWAVAFASSNSKYSS
jgi:hypothetical protein